jgi:hypothetical protein
MNRGGRANDVRLGDGDGEGTGDCDEGGSRKTTGYDGLTLRDGDGEHTGDGDEGGSRKTTESVAPDSSESQYESESGDGA